MARYIGQNEAVLHRYANEDVGVGSWLCEWGGERAGWPVGMKGAV